MTTSKIHQAPDLAQLVPATCLVAWTAIQNLASEAYHLEQSFGGCQDHAVDVLAYARALHNAKTRLRVVLHHVVDVCTALGRAEMIAELAAHPPSAPTENSSTPMTSG